MPNQLRVMVGTAGLALLLGCGEKEAELVAPVADDAGEPAVEQEFFPLNDMAVVDEANKEPTTKEPTTTEPADVTRAKEFRASESLDVDAFREQVNVEISKKDDEG